MKMEQTECSETSAYKNSDAGELPRRKHTTYRTRRKFELKNLLLLLKALQLQRSFDLLNEFFPFGPVYDAVFPICYFHFCYITFYVILPPIFRSS